jgi:hypothetical protein
MYPNRKIHGEAKAILYGMNYFYLMDKPQQQDTLLRSFLNCIGGSNAELLSRLCISFPVVEGARGQPETIRIREDSLQSLSLLQASCTNLKTLEMQVSNENSRFLAETGGGGSWFVREALLRIDAQLKTISSVEKIIIKLYVKDLLPLVTDTILGLGWVVLDW